MTASRDSHEGVPAPELEPAPEFAPAPEGWPQPAEGAYSESEEEEIAARLEALGYLE
jgi:hypothetical protein